MGENSPAEIRVSDQERESALNALGEHMRDGRINVEEYGERSAQISVAKTRGEVLQLFHDLPAPYPEFTTSAAALAPAATSVPARQRRGSDLQRVFMILAPLVFVGAIAVFVIFHVFWLFFLIPVLAGTLGGGRARRGQLGNGYRGRRRY